MKLVTVLVFFVVLAPGCFSQTTPDTQKAVEDRLTCQCGCGLTVHSCNHLQCGFAIPVKGDIAKSLAAGQTGSEILARYVAKYGEKILSSPTPTGFNLIAWYGPYVMVALGAMGILLLLRRWTGPPAGATVDANQSELSKTDRSRLERELEELDK